MSYILDALKKSEEDRREQEERQRLPYTPLSGKRPARVRNRFAPALILSSCMLLAVLVLGGGWWYLNRTGVTEDAQVAAPPAQERGEEDVPVERPKAPQIERPETPQIERPAAPPVSTLAASPAEQSSTPPAPSAPAPVTTAPATGTVAGQPTGAAAPPARKEAPPSPATGPKPEVIPLLADLPFPTRSMLPEMKFRGHVYSATPSRRMIMVNASIAREGDIIAPDLLLEEITEDGLILRFRDTVFRVKLL